MATYAISDIHGCLNTFKNLVEKGIQLARKDTLYLLGDYINKGPESMGVLDYILSLKDSGYQVICLRGNHDQLLLDAIDLGKGAIWLPKSDCKRTLNSFKVPDFTSIPEKYIRFIRSMPLFMLLDKFALVHAGCDFSFPKEALFNDPYTLLNIKNFKPDKKKLENRILIHGHTPISETDITTAVQGKSIAINLDAGCVYYKNPEFGKLASFNLNTFSLLFQGNCDRPYYIKKKQ